MTFNTFIIKFILFFKYANLTLLSSNEVLNVSTLFLKIFKELYTLSVLNPVNVSFIFFVKAS